MEYSLNRKMYNGSLLIIHYFLIYFNEYVHNLQSVLCSIETHCTIKNRNKESMTKDIEKFDSLFNEAESFILRATSILRSLGRHSMKDELRANDKEDLKVFKNDCNSLKTMALIIITVDDLEKGNPLDDEQKRIIKKTLAHEFKKTRIDLYDNLSE